MFDYIPTILLQHTNYMLLWHLLLKGYYITIDYTFIENLRIIDLISVTQCLGKFPTQSGKSHNACEHSL